MIVKGRSFKEKIHRFFVCLPLFFYGSINLKSAYIARGFKCVFAIIYLAIISIVLPLPAQVYLRHNSYSSFKDKNVLNINVIYNQDDITVFKELDLNFTIGLMYSNTEYGKDNVGNKEISWTDSEGNKYITTLIVDYSLADQAEELYYDYTKEFDTLDTSDSTRTLIVFFNSRMQVRINGRSDYFEYPVLDDFCFSEAQSAEDIGNFLVDIMSVDYISRYSYSALFSSIVFPLIFAFIVFQIVKHRNVLFKYPHAINICAISSTIPTLVTLVVCLIRPELSFYYLYELLFVLSFVVMTILLHKNAQRILHELEE